MPVAQLTAAAPPPTATASFPTIDPNTLARIHHAADCLGLGSRLYSAAARLPSSDKVSEQRREHTRRRRRTPAPTLRRLAGPARLRCVHSGGHSAGELDAGKRAADFPRRASTGKSYLASKLPDRLAELATARDPSRRRLRTVAISLDDLYLPWTELRRVAAENPGNKLLSGRGQAGTHDLELARTVLDQFKDTGRAPDAEAVIPVFEKSLHGGEGDRLAPSEWVRVEKAGEVDIVLFEGWMNGFQPPSNTGDQDDLQRQYLLATKEPEAAAVRQRFGIDYARPFFLEHPLDHLRVVERHLREYSALWSYIDVFVQLKPERLGYVWEWRLEVSRRLFSVRFGFPVPPTTRAGSHVPVLIFLWTDSKNTT